MSDRDGFLVHFSGGIQAAKLGDERWIIEPLLLHKHPSRSGPVSKSDLVKLTNQVGLWPIAFQSFGWTRGNYWSHWVPMVSTDDNLKSNPSELWANISSNFRPTSFNVRPTNLEEIAAFADEQGHEERLAHAISMSLRILDISVQSISEFYNERLVDGLASSDFLGHSFSTSVDQNFYAHVHSFFLHFGAARDYLGALLACRLGLDPSSRSTDSLPGVLSKLSSSHIGSDAILRLLEESSLIDGENGKLEQAGWLAEAGKLRNQLVHKRPYGQRFLEMRGKIVVLSQDISLYRYHRPIVDWSDGAQDVFDVILGYYRQAMLLFKDAALRSGYDFSMLSLGPSDIISLEIS